jgi:aromatic-L-amino-acid/L-tryptophan decarboxylase
MKRLALEPSEYRFLADRAVELTTELLEKLPELPSFPQTTGEKSLEAFDGPLPEQGIGRAVMDDIARVFEHSRPPSPRFFGYVLGSGEPVAAIGDLIASVLNQNVTAWRSGPAAVTIERTVVRWLAEAIGCEGFTGSLTGGGSSANLMALAMAREAKAPANDNGVQKPCVLYASAEVHMSIPKAVALLGMGHHAVQFIPVDNEFRMVPLELERAVERDRATGKIPVAVVASAGTVNTGSIDPLEEIAAIAKEKGLWMHVDGAYGALSAMAAPEKFKGLASADSLSLDPHKWLYQPLDCGCLLYRDPGAAQKTFSHSGDYAKSLYADPIEGFEFFEQSMELSRRFRALKLWLSFRYHGIGAFRDSIRGDLQLAQELAAMIKARKELEILAPVPLSAVCFRYIGEGTRSDEELNALNARMLQRMQRGGRVFISNATINGKFALRACIVNHRSTSADVEAVLTETLAAAKAELARL